MASPNLDLVGEFDLDYNLNFADSNTELDLFSESLFYTDPKSSLAEDPILTSLSNESNNVLDVVDLPQNKLDQSAQSNTAIWKGSKKSPWHESDSGVSETISVGGSPEHTIFDHHSTMQDADGTFDNELAAYLNSDDDRMGSPSANSNSESEDLSFFTNVLDHDPVVDIDLASNDFLAVSKESSKTVVKGASNVNANCSGPSEVKILKVVRPSNTSTGVTSEDIAKAMDERSKKNAVQAKLNREKKKAYIQSLEGKVDDLASSNKTLQSENAKLKQEMADKDEEIDYLKAVLANSSALSGLLKNITEVKEVKLSATIMTRKRAATGDHSYNLVESAPQKRARLIDANLKKAGVCLHVSGGSACLEFCAHCSKLAKKSYSHS